MNAPPQDAVDWKQVGVISGALLGLLALFRYLLHMILPNVEKAVRKILAPELAELSAAVRDAKACADAMRELVALVRSLDEEMTDVFAVVRTHRELLADINEIVPKAFGVDRREDERRRAPELPQLPERRRVSRRRDDTQ